jgi:hypothetical protein
VTPLRQRLAAAEADLRAHMNSWEYAFAMGAVCCGSEHPRSWATRAKTDHLKRQVRDLRAQVAEHEIPSSEQPSHN